MKRRYPLVVFAAVAALLFGAISSPAAAARLTLKLKVDGTTRTALVEPGQQATTTPSPLVLVFHSYRGSPELMATRFAGSWPEATFVYPQGLTIRNPFENSTAPGWQHLPGDYNDRDLRFVDALLREISATVRVDERQVYSTGFSSGAFFTYLLLALRPERFAAFAPVAIEAPPYLKWARVPRPVLIVQGKHDYPGAAEWARNQILRLNGCGPAVMEWSPNTVSYQPCNSRQPVIWSLFDGGHMWPQGASGPIVRFFKEHALPAPLLPSDIEPSVPDEGQGAGAMLVSVAGTGLAGFSGDGGSATAARLNFPQSVALDSAGQLFIADSNNFRIRKVGPDGTIMTAAGSNLAGFNQADRATRAQLYGPEGLALDRMGQLFIADTYNRRVLKAAPDGAIRTMAGIGPHEEMVISFSGDGGPGIRAELSFPTGLAVDRDGNLFIADTENHRIRKVGLDGTITTIAGTGMAGFSGDGGAATAAQLHAPWGLAVDREGSLFIADAGNHRVRKLLPDGTITTVAGVGTPGLSGDEDAATAAALNHPTGVAVDSQGTLFIVDLRNHRIRKVRPDGTITTVFGAAAAGGSGDASSTPRYYPSSVAVDRAGNLLIADPFHQQVWKLSGIAAPGLIAGQLFAESGSG
jgi:poly(3-hydroxybutyrate) depolymerase/sugar lactone lactonase YvrE